ncbi:MAG TPA: PLP-dependent aminotransferase family protein [Noviherbaspirillum sp.]|uniref:aminotransferase-like domain-containing protein n=1 Tax=Noviherbaspirillum sp. TaxID=1926288 RepID=UPI002D6BB6D6|nr:PLP-dependent aminotransferase family protein [Noviherbaspirillum sp.]HYD96848.1 PLP-dependent aminotransferase family protein [Noviherbaspirillum sp.]
MARERQDAFQLQLVPDSGQSLVDQVAAKLAQRIEAGVLRAGERLPSVRQFAAMHGISVSTTVDAYERLVATGLLFARRGAGFFVHRRDGTRDSGRPLIPHNPEIDSAWLLSEVFADDRVPIKAGCGWLPQRLLDAEGLHMAERRVLRAPAAQQVGYGHPYGYVPLRQTIAQSLGRWSLDVSVDQVVTTHGATQALDLIVRTMVKRGDTVFMEDPGYCNLMAILRLAEVRVVGVPRTPNGVDLEALERLAREHQPRLFFTNPVLQNPTGTSYTPACAMRVLQIADRYNFWVVEDDLYRELAQPTDPMLAALDGLQRVIYVGGFSKTIAPSLRMGFAACQPELARELARTKMALTLTSSEITERLVHAVLTEGHHRKHVERLSASLLHAQSRIAARLEEAGLIPFAAPRGGMFYWARLDRPGMRAREIADRALKKGIWLAPGEFFQLSQSDCPWFRFNVAYSDAPELLEFFRTI